MVGICVKLSVKTEILKFCTYKLIIVITFLQLLMGFTLLSLCSDQTTQDSISVIFLAGSDIKLYKKSSLRKLHCWIDYLQYLGIKRLYVYDAYKNHPLKWWLDEHTSSNFAIYHDWSLFQELDTDEQMFHAFSHTLWSYDDPTEWKLMLTFNHFPKDNSAGDWRLSKGYSRNLLYSIVHRKSGNSSELHFTGEELGRIFEETVRNSGARVVQRRVSTSEEVVKSGIKDSYMVKNLDIEIVNKKPREVQHWCAAK